MRIDIKRTSKYRFGDRQPGLPILINFLLVIVIYWQKKKIRKRFRSQLSSSKT